MPQDVLQHIKLLKTGIINGAVAQLGERRVRNAEVGSSILLGSTRSNRRRHAVRTQIFYFLVNF
jgi:hypothetical protein